MMFIQNHSTQAGTYYLASKIARLAVQANVASMNIEVMKK
jgi:hypothetical protein